MFQLSPLPNSLNEETMYEKRLEELRLTNTGKKLPELNIAEDLEGVMMKVKTKVSYYVDILVKTINK
jgi:hypothetical protein